MYLYAFLNVSCCRIQDFAINLNLEQHENDYSKRVKNKSNIKKLNKNKSITFNKICCKRFM